MPEHIVSAKDLSELDSLYADRSPDGRPTCWRLLVEELRKIRRMVEAGTVVHVAGGATLRTWPQSLLCRVACAQPNPPQLGVHRAFGFLGLAIRLWSVLTLRERYTKTLLVHADHAVERRGPYADYRQEIRALFPIPRR